MANYGSLAATFLRAVGKPTTDSDAFFELMKPRNPWLMELSGEFVQLANRISPSIELCCFFELLPIEESIAKDFKFGPFASIMQDLSSSSFFVDIDSATFGTKHYYNNRYGLQSNHSDLVKFKNATDPKYQIVLSRLRSLIDDAVSNARKRSAASKQGSMPPQAVDALRGLLDSGMRQKHQARLDAQQRDSWVVQDQSYLAWETGPQNGSSCLCVVGPAGVGKTSASLSAIGRIRNRIDEQVAEGKPNLVPLLAYFLCDSSPVGSSATELVKSLLLQLINQNPRLADYAKQFLRKTAYQPISKLARSGLADDNNDTKATMSLQNLWDCLQNMMADDSLGDIYIIINNMHCLDNHEYSQKLISFIHDCFIASYEGFTKTTATGARKWLFTSAPKQGNHPLKKLINPKMAQILDLSTGDYAKKVKNSLESHVKEQVVTLAHEKHYQRDQRYLIQDMLIDHGDNKHWIDIQCIRLGGLKENTDTDTILRTLGITSASSLKELVCNIWSTVLDQNPTDRHLLNELLKVLLLAFRSPSPQELSVLAAIEDVKKVEKLIERCAPMIQLVPDDAGVARIELVNATMKDHLLSGSYEILGLSRDSNDDDELQPETLRFHGVLARRCFSYLEKVAQTLISPSTLDESDESEAFLGGNRTQRQTSCPYPLEYWLGHAIKGKAELAEDLVRNLPDFWRRKSHMRDAWLAGYLKATPGLNPDLGCEGMTALHIAALVGYSGLAERLLRQGHKDECVAINEKGYTPLHVAAHYNRAEMVTVLLGYGHKEVVEMGTGGIGTALHVAAVQGHVDTVKILLDHGGDPNALNNEHGPVVNAAVQSGNNEVVQLLLEDKRINLDFDNLERKRFPRPLALSAARSEQEVFRQILVGGKAKWKAEDYSSALIDGCSCNKLDNVKLLLSLDEQHHFENAVLEEAMLTAAVEHNWGCVLAILDLGRQELDCNNIFYIAAVTMRNLSLADEVLRKLWETRSSTIHPEVTDAALYQAADNQKGPTVAWLLDHCHANANSTDKEPGMLSAVCFQNNPLLTFGNALSAAAWDGTKNIVEMLLDHGAQVESSQGCALQLAAKEGHSDVVELLLSKGARVDRVPAEEHDYQGPPFPDGTALQAACRYNKTDAVRVLLKWKANPNMGRGAYTNPLLAATQRNLPEVLELLLAAPDIQVNISGGDDRSTPLINAASYMSPEATEWLLKAGADVNHANANGDTALITAAWKGDAATLRLLCDDGASILYDSPNQGFALAVAVEQGHIECVQVLVTRLTPIFRGLNRAIARGSTFVRKLVANPEEDHAIVDMQAFSDLEQRNSKLCQELEELRAIRRGWDEMQGKVRQAEINKERSEQQMHRMEKDREEEKATTRRERDEYRTARYAFPKLQEEAEALKQAFAASQAKLATQKDEYNTVLQQMQAEVNQSHLRADTLQKRLNIAQEGAKNAQQARMDNIALRNELDEAQRKLDYLSRQPNSDHSRTSGTSNHSPRHEDTSDISLPYVRVDDEDAESKSSGKRPGFMGLGGSSSSISSWGLRKKGERREDEDEAEEGAGDDKKRSSFPFRKKKDNSGS
ncbi:hypothetical protein Neosp_003198 [[Neocosmospora] mangrovei]